MRILVEATKLPEIWEIFQITVSVSPIYDSGFSLTMLETVLPEDYVGQWTNTDFWNIMEAFLSGFNDKFRKEKKKAMDEASKKRK